MVLKTQPYHVEDTRRLMVQRDPLVQSGCVLRSRSSACEKTSANLEYTLEKVNGKATLGTSSGQRLRQRKSGAVGMKDGSVVGFGDTVGPNVGPKVMVGAWDVVGELVGCLEHADR